MSLILLARCWWLSEYFFMLILLQLTALITFFISDFELDFMIFINFLLTFNDNVHLSCSYRSCFSLFRRFMVKPQTSDIRMAYEYIRVRYEWHASGIRITCGSKEKINLTFLKNFLHTIAVLDYLPGLKSGLGWLLLKPGPGPLKTWTLKNLDPEKHEYWKTWNK